MQKNLGKPATNERLNRMDKKNNIVKYTPLIVPGLIYNSVLTCDFHQLMLSSDHVAPDRLLTEFVTKYFERQNYLMLKAEKLNSSKLSVPQEVFSSWMKKGCIDFKTYIILRDSVMRKGYRKRMAIRKDLEIAKKILSHVGTATTKLIDKVDTSDFRKEIILVKKKDSPPALPQQEKSSCQLWRLVSDLPKSCTELVKFNPNDVRKSKMKQVLYGIIFGLTGAKVFCNFIMRLVPPKLVEPSMSSVSLTDWS